MARLLKPSEFGILAMAAPILAFVQLFSDLGLTQVTIQRPTISQSQLSLIFWVGVLVSVTAGVIVILGSSLAADFYHEPKIAPVLVALGLILMLSGFYNQHTAVLNRQLRFGTLAIIDLASFAAGSAIGIVAALAGYSYWSLVINQAAVSLISLVLAWSLTRWIPSRPAWVENSRAILGFGGNVTSFNFFNFFARNLDNILIGRKLGEVQLGFYDRAYKLLLLPLSQINGPISKVATPLLSRVAGEPKGYLRAYLLMLELVLLLTCPAMIVAGIASKLIVATVLGPQWWAAAPVFQILAIGGLFAPISNSTGWLFTTQDRTAEMRNYGFFSSLAFIVSFIVGLHWGILGVASCYISVGAVQGPLIWYGATRRGPVTMKDLLSALLPYLVAGIITAVFTVATLAALSPGWFAVVALIALGYGTFVASMAVLPRGRATIFTLIQEAVRLVRRKKT